ncbi:hypothetical protein NX722_21060 [Endozoicomonas gorgoniicola]|uniref:Porin n=1 Tax=Endozoicomonas gorgoniicola TaxID=1234144 RepID=A0ABT3N0B8_9GAMM|nr:hypothetical protein [Endozoicomonas gorgoniicola]MCW7555067.1 hypothetical protein [Endozoicomonas gorgoniicola]
MNSRIKTNLTGVPLILLSSAMAAPSVHGEESIDPSDITNTYTYLWSEVGNRDYKFSVGLASDIASKYNILGLVEHTRTWDQGSEVNNTSRVRFYGVRNLEGDLLRGIGTSVDYIKGHDSKMDITALGVIGKLNSFSENLSFAPNVGYVSVEHKMGGVKKEKSEGYQAYVLASVVLGEDGRYLSFQPEYIDTKNIDADKLEVIYNQPVSSDQKWWINVTGFYQKTKIDYAGFKKSDTEEHIKLGVTYYL